MIKRSTWVMVVLLAILAGLAYYLKQPDNLIKKALASGATPTVAPLGQLLASTAGPLKGIRIQSADGKSVVLDRQPTGWIFTLDGQSSIPADQGAAEQAASQALGISLVTKIETKGPDLSAFGLDKPAYIYELIQADGKPVTFKIGNVTPTQSGYYLQKEDGSVVVVDKSGLDSLLNLLTQPPYMFTPTPSPVPVTETPTPGATPTAELTPTKQP